MITILGRYIAKTIFRVTGLVALIITGVLILLNLLGEMKNIGEGDYGLVQAVFYVLLRLPNALYEFFPMLMLLGAVVGLSILSGNKELAVMRTSGFSMNRIVSSILGSALVLIILVTLIGELLGPRWSHRAEINKENAQNAGQAVVTAAGVWLHVDDNFIHVEHVVNRERLEGVTRYQFNPDHQLKAAYFAQALMFKNNKWQMQNGVKTSFYPDRTKSITFEAADWNLKFNTNLLNIGLIDANEMTLPKLSKFIRYLEKNGLQANEYRHEFWQRIFQPLASLIMVFLALPFVLGARHNVSLGWRVLISVLVGFSFYILNALMAQLSIVFQVPAAFAAFLPLIIFAVIAILLNKKMLNH